MLKQNSELKLKNKSAILLEYIFLINSQIRNEHFIPVTKQVNVNTKKNNYNNYHL